MQTPVYIPCAFTRREPVGDSGTGTLAWELRAVEGVIIAFVGVGTAPGDGSATHDVLAVVMLASGALVQKYLHDLVVLPTPSVVPEGVAS